MPLVGHNVPTWQGQLFCVTGGTTAYPRLVVYTPQVWEHSVQLKEELLRVYGVSSTSRVLICHPFMPWSIGMVHTEAALRCGADVYPIGLNANQPSFIQLINLIRPTHVCGSARTLIRLAQSMDASALQEAGTVFVAGELLNDVHRRQCEALWQRPVVNVYGMAELDMLGAQLPNSKALSLMPGFEFQLTQGQERVPMAVGQSGELLVRRLASETVSDSAWYATGDWITVEDQQDFEPFGRLWTITLHGRVDESVSLMDGTLILGQHIDRLLAQSDELSEAQLSVKQSPTGDELELRCVVNPTVINVCDQTLRDRLLNINIDLSDCYNHGLIRAFEVRCVTEAELVKTERGKVCRVVQEPSYAESA
jgi:phenylacetate-coenzyme A ligase PaaK-like adenylate-forming protein